MAHTKQEVMHELRSFMQGFAHSVSRMYSSDVLPSMLGINPSRKADSILRPEECAFDHTSLWEAVSAMYDYGVSGIPSDQSDLSMTDGIYADTELFVTAIDSAAMRLYLQEDETDIPSKVIRTVQTAVARHILEGGERYTDFGAISEGGYGAGHLSIKEIALLADMDERSVRNASNPKTPGALKTVQIGKRTMVEPEEAKRWLSGRKGYVPLQKLDAACVSPAAVTRISIELRSDVLAALERSAVTQGVSLDLYLARVAGKGVPA